MNNEGNRMKPASNNDLEFRDSNQDNLDMDNKRASQTAIDTMVVARRRIMRQTQMLLDVDYNDIRSLVTHNLDEAKSKSLQNAFDMLDDYHQEKALAQEIGIPSVRMLKYLPAMELLETSEMEDVYKFYILKKEIYILQKEIRTIFKSINNSSTTLIAASGKSVDTDFQWSPDHKIHTQTQDGRYLIEIGIINNRLEFMLKPNDNHAEEIEILKEQLKSGILQFGSFPEIEITDGFGELDFSKIDKEKERELNTLPHYCPLKI